MRTIRPKEGIERIALYVGGDSRLPGRGDVLKLSSNENPLGPPPEALRAIAEASDDLHRYPPSDHAALRAAIGRVHKLDPARILCGAGSDEIIHFLCTAYAGPGTEVVHTEHGFAMYRISALASGAEPVEAAETDRRVDVDRILSVCTDRTRLVFVASPANPTGTVLSQDEIARLARDLPSAALLVLDGAYAEFDDGNDGGAALATARGNVVMTRTFSKLYGLGGLRVGWAYGPRAVIADLDRVRGPFNLSQLQLAGAEAALGARDWIARALDVNARGRARLTEGLRALGLAVDDSHANFVLARFADAAAAAAADAALREAGILVRRVAGYGFPEGLRITVGDASGVDRVLAALAAHRETGA